MGAQTFIHASADGGRSTLCGLSTRKLRLAVSDTVEWAGNPHACAKCLAAWQNVRRS